MFLAVINEVITSLSKNKSTDKGGNVETEPLSTVAPHTGVKSASLLISGYDRPFHFSLR